MKKFEISVYQRLTRTFYVEVEAEDREDARNIYYSMTDSEMGEGYEKLLDSDWEINEVKDV